MNQCTKGENPITVVSNYCSCCGIRTSISPTQKPPFKIPVELSSNKQTVNMGYLATLGSEFDPNDWSYYIPAFSQFIHSLGIPKQNSNYYRLLSREDLKLISSGLNVGKGSVEELFIASQIWGWGTGGRGMSHTGDAVKTPGFGKIVNDVFSLVKQGDIYKAYISMKVPGCGAAYISKFLYFSALGCNISPLPVILDGRVVNSLMKIGMHEGWLAKEFADFSINSSGSIFVEKNPTKYIVYMEQMDLWAKSLGCPADYIEFYLWSTG